MASKKKAKKKSAPKKKKAAAKRKSTPKKFAVKKAMAKKSVKKAVKKPVKKAAKKSGAPKKKEAPKMTVIPPPGGVLIGRVEDYFAHINVMALTLQKPLSIGDRLQILGHTTQMDLVVESMQTDHQPIQNAQAGQGVGIKVSSRVRKRDYVFLLPR